jgi:hypothetical protein
MIIRRLEGFPRLPAQMRWKTLPSRGLVGASLALGSL